MENWPCVGLMAMFQREKKHGDVASPKGINHGQMGSRSSTLVVQGYTRWLNRVLQFELISTSQFLFDWYRVATMDI